MAETYDDTEGDDALAAGLDVMDGTEKWFHGWKAINKTRDMIANLAAGIRSIATGGTGASTAAGARVNLGVQATVDDVAAAVATIAADKLVRANGAGQIAVPDPAYTTSPTPRSYVDTATGGKVSKSGDTMTGALRNTWARANSVGSWINLGVAPDGTIGNTSSSRRFKKNIRDWTPDRQALLAIRLVQFKYRAAVYASDDTTQHGVIAEELHDLGLTWLVAYDENGDPYTVHYDRIALGLLSLVQDHEARLTALEGKE